MPRIDKKVCFTWDEPRRRTANDVDFFADTVSMEHVNEVFSLENTESKTNVNINVTLSDSVLLSVTVRFTIAII